VITGIIGVFLSIALVLNTSGVPAAFGCILVGIFFSLISVSAFPYALQNLSKRQVTFGTGIFFGCTELADGILNIWLF
jgi:Kef-type K+ transport system membrane component KefB